MDDHIKELFKHHNDVYAKRVDVLIAIAVACVGFSVTRSTGLSPSWPMLFLAIAVLAWGASVYAGIRNREHVLSTIRLNVDFLLAKAGAEPLFGRDPMRIAIGAVAIWSLLELDNLKVQACWKWQCRLLFIGALLFLIWHVTDMFAR